ncbi:MAG: hypothetical protein NC390_01765 [Fusobacterium sp.]|nr:hypothetical protein [Fusobacterium sp.]
MVKCLKNIKSFLVGMFTQDESVGLKSMERIKVVQEISIPKKNEDFKFSDIMK